MTDNTPNVSRRTLAKGAAWAAPAVAFAAAAPAVAASKACVVINRGTARWCLVARTSTQPYYTYRLSFTIANPCPQCADVKVTSVKRVDGAWSDNLYTGVPLFSAVYTPPTTPWRVCPPNSSQTYTLSDVYGTSADPIRVTYTVTPVGGTAVSHTVDFSQPPVC